jgi:hypothetical protein
VDGVTAGRYEREPAHNQETLARQLHDGTYRAQPVLRIHIPKSGGKKRTHPLGIPCFRDRIAQHALKQVIEPIHETTFHPSSYGFRPRRGCPEALAEVSRLMESGYMDVHRAEFTFLGYCFRRNVNKHGQSRILALVSDKSASRLRDTLRRHTGRCNGCRMAETIRRVNLTLRGWYNYFKYCATNQLVEVDQYVRRRLRRILRKRSKRRRGTGRSRQDHLKWSNAFFRELGHFSMEEARHREV